MRMIGEAMTFKLFLISMLIFLSGCKSDSDFKVGQKVTNGICEGYITNKYIGFAIIGKFDCLNFVLYNASVDYDELEVVE